MAGAGLNGEWTDIISDFVEITSSVVTPDNFKLWSGISLVAGALERRVWAETGDYITFPNLYVYLVAPPGTGKKIVESVRAMWELVQEPGTSKAAYHVAPNSMTAASLVDAINKSKNIKLTPTGPPVTFHSLLIAAEEASVLIPAWEPDYIGRLNYIWENPDWYREARRTGSVRELNIENPQLNLLLGAQPAWLAALPPDVWNTGFGRRLIMVYSSERPQFDIFTKAITNTPEVKAKFIRKLGLLATLWGPVRWSPEATELFRPLALDGKGPPPVPSHSKLTVYVNSRIAFIIKLATVSAVSRTLGFQIEAIDVRRAIAWLLEAERFMPDIFRAMIGKSDRDVIDELHLFVSAMFAKQKRAPVTGDSIRRFLIERVPHEKVETILLAADRANIIARVAGEQDKWVPRPRYNQGEPE